jgi:hypothetical protein
VEKTPKEEMGRILRRLSLELREDTAKLEPFELGRVPFNKVRDVAERAHNRAGVVAQALEHFAAELLSEGT